MSDRLSRSSPLAQVIAVVVGFAVAGAGCGVLWWWAWSPPTGSVVDGAWYPGEPGLRGEFRGTGWYVVIALAAGLVLGAVSAWRCDRAELATLAAVVVGSVVAGLLMREVGQHLGPADPQTLARTTTRTTLPDDLRVSGWSPLVAFPLGSLLGLCVVYLLATTRRGPTAGADVPNPG